MSDKKKSIKELSKEIEKASKELRYYSDKEKILKRRVIPQLTRSQRTSRLCRRAGMLEKFLDEPDLLTDDQVFELIRVAFRQPEVQKTLKEMIEKAKNREV